MNLLLLLVAGGFEFGGQATASAGLNHSARWFGRAACEYRPEVRLGLGAYDAEVSARGSCGLDWRLFDSTGGNLSLKPYRAFLRYSRERFEVRAGLQQINFGSAALLRPLRWFDRLDPRDPLKTTDGVYGLLGRGYSGNSNAWLWGLIGNRDPKGTELTPTPQWSPEVGGRAELELPRGDAAASAHFRRTILAPTDTVAEQRLGFDARFDVGIGLWTEATASRIAAGTGGRWLSQAMLGTDYTFGIGNGLTLLFEHAASGSPWRHISAASLSYPLGIFDNLQAFFFFDWSSRRPYSYVAWQRTWNSWILLVAGFWNPDTPSAAGPAGHGGQLSVVFNH
ncbi:MAG: hypothetical protein ABIK37_04325 [candidate division WOR-3 bacterium]